MLARFLVLPAKGASGVRLRGVMAELLYGVGAAFLGGFRELGPSPIRQLVGNFGFPLSDRPKRPSREDSEAQ